MDAKLEALYQQTLANMETTLHGFCVRVNPPDAVNIRGGDEFVFRYKDQTVHQALVQKLARYISGLHAARLLLSKGFMQEQGAMQRILDELQEDILFLAYSVILNKKTDDHVRYLTAFYEEEFDLASGLPTTQRRPMVPRKKIRAYLANVGGLNDPHGAANTSRTVSKAYSGYVHAASPHIMDMYGGQPPQFHVRGVPNAQLLEDHAYDLWNYFYRGILATAICAKAFGLDSAFDDIRGYASEFARETDSLDRIR